MKQPLTLSLIALLITLTVALPVVLAPAYGAVSTFKIEGYITDSLGVPIADAFVTFNNITIPWCMSNTSGYYSVNAPAGNYLINVWPPYDSHYINYGEIFHVTADATQNITLVTGCKVSGYVYNETGSPMIAAAVLFGVSSTEIYGSGYFTNETGYYYANLQPGTYTIDAHPRTKNEPTYSGYCSNFTTYTEPGFTVTADIVKNLTVGVTPTPTPTPTQSSSSSSSSSTTTTTTHATAKPTLTPAPTQPTLTITTQGNFYPSLSLNLTGQLQDQNGNPLNQKTITLTYQLQNSTSWVNIGTTQTDAQGNYLLPWTNTFSGDSCFLVVKAQYTGDTSHLSTSNITTLSYASDLVITNQIPAYLDFAVWLIIAITVTGVIVVLVLIRRFKPRK